MGPELGAVLVSTAVTGATALLGATVVSQVARTRPTRAALATPFVVVVALAVGVAAATRAMVVAGDDYRTVVFVLLAGAPMAAVVGAALSRHVSRVHADLRASERARTLAEEAETTRRQTLQWLSHDLRTPLTGIRVLAESAGMDQVIGQVDRIDRMVDDLAALSEVRGHDDRPRALVALDDLVSDAVAGLLPQAAEAGVRIVEGGSDGGTVEVDAALVGRAVTNLLRNAVEHSRAGSEVEVTTRRDGDDALLEVRDDGPGVAEEDAEHVFEAGWRGDLSRHRAGTGLGLAITREVARRHGGDVTVRPGPGAVFTLRLPRLLTDR